MGARTKIFTDIDYERDGKQVVIYNGEVIPVPENGQVGITGTASAVFAADWDGDGDHDLIVGDINGNVAQASSFATNTVIPVNVENFVLGVAEQNFPIASSGQMAAVLDEIRASPAPRSAAYARAEALAHFERLLQFGAEEQP